MSPPTLTQLLFWHYSPTRACLTAPIILKIMLAYIGQGLVMHGYINTTVFSTSTEETVHTSNHSPATTYIRTYVHTVIHIESRRALYCDVDKHVPSIPSCQLFTHPPPCSCSQPPTYTTLCTCVRACVRRLVADNRHCKDLCSAMVASGSC